MRESFKKMVWLLPLLLLTAALAACGPAETTTPCPPTQECPDCPPTPTCPPTAVPEDDDGEPAVEVPFLGQWQGSGHADADSESFTHWDEDDPPVIPPVCAKCHSALGFKDFVGVDGTEAGVVNNAADIGTVVNCTVCHNEGVQTMTAVTFPSGIEVTGLGEEAVCYQCHQGRASTQDVRDAIEEAGVDADSPTEELGFVNIHYYAAAATRLGTWVDGGYQYQGNQYDRKFRHVEEFDTCHECHDAHSLEVRVGTCSECHPDVGSREDLENIRLQGSLNDYDGDGNITEGIFYEIQGLQEILIGAIQTYAGDVIGTPIVYDSASYPYWFVDTNDNGEVDEDEAAYPNRYTTWTPRLVKAAYNYQTSLKDPGNYSHGPKYHIQLLYDSIMDLDESLVEGLTREDPGHFDGSSESFRHWDEDGEVPGACSKCHSATGLPTYLQEGAAVSEPIANGLQCRTCHDQVPGYSMRPVAQVTFPSGATLSFGEEAAGSNMCLECHQGRQSTQDVRQAIGGAEPDTVVDGLGFVNVHYFAAGATVFGAEASGAYQYEGQSYVGQFDHVDSFDECIECHTAHGLEIKAEGCTECHDIDGADDLASIRTTGTDFDGDGDTDEGIAGEIETLHEALLDPIKTYAEEVIGTPIVYDAHAYPYWFVDTDGDGEVDEDEANYGNRYTSWTPRLLRAAYNYQYVSKDPGGYSHNPMYIIQILQDSLSAMADWTTLDLATLTRPEGE